MRGVTDHLVGYVAVHVYREHQLTNPPTEPVFTGAVYFVNDESYTKFMEGLDVLRLWASSVMKDNPGADIPINPETARELAAALTRVADSAAEASEPPRSTKRPRPSTA
jgi:hypothetical protein